MTVLHILIAYFYWDFTLGVMAEYFEMNVILSSGD